MDTCREYFGEYASCMISDETNLDFSLRVEIGKFPKVNIEPGESVRSCFVNYDYWGPDYTRTRGEAKKLNKATFNIKFNGATRDQIEEITGKDALVGFLTEFYDMRDVELVCLPIRNKQKEADRVNAIGNEIRRVAQMELEPIFYKVFREVIQIIRSVEGYEHTLPRTRKQHLLQVANELSTKIVNDSTNWQPTTTSEQFNAEPDSAQLWDSINKISTLLGKMTDNKQASYNNNF